MVKAADGVGEDAAMDEAEGKSHPSSLPSFSTDSRTPAPSSYPPLLCSPSPPDDNVAGTEDGIKEPQATFLACFGAAFIMHHPTKYAGMLAKKMQNYGATGWLVNTGWSGGRYGVGSRIKILYTRKIIDAIHSRSLLNANCIKMEVFGLEIPTKIEEVSLETLNPVNDAKATDLTNRARTVQKRKREKEKNNGVRLEKKFKKEVEENDSKPQGGAQKEMSYNPNAAEAGVPRDKKAEMKKNKKVGAINEKGAGNANNNGRSIYQDMTHFREELAEARRER